MMYTVDATLRSWVPVSADSDFPIQNLPYGVFQTSDGHARVGVAIGDYVLDLGFLHRDGFFGDTLIADRNVFDQPVLNDFLAMGRRAWSQVRKEIVHLLMESNPELREDIPSRHAALIPMNQVRMLVPVKIGAFVDFYSSIEHATNVGSMFRDPKNPLLPNWRHIPIGYNGRASSVVVSGTDVHRPAGQTKAESDAGPKFGPTRELDFELEVGFVAGPGNVLGSALSTSKAVDHIFGLVLVNDWSARDVQRWEYVPLGPFLSKSFATTISPWIVPLDALEPFRVAGPKQDPPVLGYLQYEGNWAYDVNLEVWLQSASDREPTRISRTNFKTMYWNMLQQLAHQTSNGTNVQPGDLYASGTVSGSTEDSRGCLLELTWKGTKPLRLPGDQMRTFLEDGDSVVMRGYAQGDGYRIGFGECRGRVAAWKVANGE